MSANSGQPDNALQNAFAQARGGDPAERKAFFAAIRAGDHDAVMRTLQAHAGAALWQEPFAPEEQPYAADDTPLMAAAHARKTEIVKTLLEHGAAETVDTRNCRGYTALMYAAWQGAEGVAEVLLWRGADSWARNEHGQDADMLARLRGHDVISAKIQAHRSKTDGPAAFTNGLSKDVAVLKPLTIRKRPHPPA